MTGQLGNQMFQYAIYRKYQLKGADIKMDMSYYDSYPHYNSITIFNIDIKLASRKETLIEKDEYRTYLNRIRRKFYGRRQNVISEIGVKTYSYNPNIFSLKRGFIDGYWQSELYFDDIKEQLLRDFTFPKIVDTKNSELLKRVHRETSVSIHVRRGDYLGGFPVMDMDYFNPAIEKIKSVCDNPHYYIFSNDIEWCRANFTNIDCTFVDWNSGAKSYIDMYLMSQCKHNVIVNSSFSWWGAWLNCNNNKIVVAPSTWFYHAKTPNIYCKDWIVI